MLLPTLQQLEFQYSSSQIVVVMDKPQSLVLAHLGYTVIPVAEFDITDYDDVQFLNVSHCCLDYERQRNVCKSRFDLFAEHCGVSVFQRGKIVVTPEERAHIYDRMPMLKKRSNGYKIIGLVLKSARDYCSYPHIELLADYFSRVPLFDSLVRKAIPIIIDHEGTVKDYPSTSDLDLRETIAFINELDLVIGPDTGPMHIASTLGIPTLWLFGPTDPSLRLLYYPDAEHIWHPCQKGKACWYDYCEEVNCLWKISPWQVAREAKRILSDTVRL